ncbi:MAG: hypothetical protein RSA97_07995 [Oscillospiraceae bacterium]
MMKKVCLISAIFCIAFALCACAKYRSDNDVSVFVSPTLNGGENLLVGQAPSAALPEKIAQTPSVKFGVDSKTVFTANMQWEFVDYAFVSEELTFYVPEAWRDCFYFEMEEKQVDDFAVRHFLYYVTDPNTDVKAQVYRIVCVTSEYRDKYGAEYGTPLGTSANGAYYYTGIPVAEDVPDGFTNGEVFVEVANEILSMDFSVAITV